MTEKLAPPNPPLSDGVITLRPFRADDAPAIAAACQDQEIQRWIPIIPVPYTEVDARGFILMTLEAWHEGTGYEFAVADAATGSTSGRTRGAMPSAISSRPRLEAVVLPSGHSASSPTGASSI